MSRPETPTWVHTTQELHTIGRTLRFEVKDDVNLRRAFEAVQSAPYTSGGLFDKPRRHFPHVFDTHPAAERTPMPTPESVAGEALAALTEPTIDMPVVVPQRPAEPVVIDAAPQEVPLTDTDECISREAQRLAALGAIGTGNTAELDNRLDQALTVNGQKLGRWRHRAPRFSWLRRKR